MLYTECLMLQTGDSLMLQTDHRVLNASDTECLILQTHN